MTRPRLEMSDLTLAQYSEFRRSGVHLHPATIRHTCEGGDKLHRYTAGGSVAASDVNVFTHEHRAQDHWKVSGQR